MIGVSGYVSLKIVPRLVGAPRRGWSDHGASPWQTDHTSQGRLIVALYFDYEPWLHHEFERYSQRTTRKSWGLPVLAIL